MLSFMSATVSLLSAIQPFLNSAVLSIAAIIVDPAPIHPKSVRCCCNALTALAVTAAAHSSAGEVFGGLNMAPGANDSQALLQALSQGNVPKVFNCLRGPWAAVYWHAPTRTLWFGRDVLGEFLCAALWCASFGACHQCDCCASPAHDHTG